MRENVSQTGSEQESKNRQFANLLRPNESSRRRRPSSPQQQQHTQELICERLCPESPFVRCLSVANNWPGLATQLEDSGKEPFVCESGTLQPFKPAEVRTRPRPVREQPVASASQYRHLDLTHCKLVLKNPDSRRATQTSSGGRSRARGMLIGDQVGRPVIRTGSYRARARSNDQASAILQLTQQVLPNQTI